MAPRRCAARVEESDSESNSDASTPDDNAKSFSNDCKKLFNTTNLYEILGLNANNAKNETAATIKSAYKKASLRYHPDRAKEADRDKAKMMFQAMYKAYEVLSDTDRRQIYDETGAIDDDFLGTLSKRDCTRDWADWFQEIDSFTATYKGSAEELCEIREAYEKSKGDLMKIILNVMCATYDDEARFTTIINKLIADGDVQPYKQFTNESDASKAKRRKWFELEAKKAAVAVKELKENNGGSASAQRIKAAASGNMDDLAIMIRSKNRTDSSSFLDNLEAKYASPSAKKTKKK